MTISRTFIVRVSESPRRVLVEDVREQRQAIAVDLASVGAQIAAWIEPGMSDEREDPVSAEPYVRAREPTVEGGPC